jgi:hypothetical protein
VTATDREAVIEARDVGRMVVREGQEAVLALRPDVDRDYVRNIVQGPILETILHQRGFVVLHASSVARDGVGVVFAADSGSGKSTLAGAMNALGWGVVADDVTAIRVAQDGLLHIYPGLPHVNLWPESVSSLGLDTGQLMPVHPQSRKCIWHTLVGHMASPTFLGRVFFLSKASSAGIDRLGPQQAFVSILRNVPLMISRLIAGTTEEARIFPQYARLAGMVPTYRINQPHTPESLASIGQLAEQVEGIALGHAS